MKISVREEDAPQPLKTIRVTIKNLNSGLEHIRVRIFHMAPTEKSKKPAKPRKSIKVIDQNEIESKKTVTDPTQKSTKTIAINLTLPDLPIKKWLVVVKNRLPKFSKKIYLAIGLIFVALIVGTYFVFGTQSKKPINITASGGLPQLTKGTPNYQTILPAGKNILTLGGWTRISPPNKIRSTFMSTRLTTSKLMSANNRCRQTCRPTPISRCPNWLKISALLINSQSIIRQSISAPLQTTNSLLYFTKRIF